MLDLTLQERLSLELSKRALTPLGERPLYVGDDWDLTLLARDLAGEPIDLTAAKIFWSLYKEGGALVRDSATDITGALAGTKQIAILPGQAGADRGKFTLRWRRYPGEVSLLEGLFPAAQAGALAELAAWVRFDIVISLAFADPNTRQDLTFAAGRIEVLKGVLARPPA